MDNIYLINCPMCGASINYMEGEQTAICPICRIITYRRKQAQDTNPYLKYAVITDSETYATVRDCKIVQFTPIDSDFVDNTALKLDAYTLSKLDSLIYELNVNFSGDIRLGPQELQRRTRIVEEILAIDNNNIYARFIKDIVASSKRSLSKYEEIFKRLDALVIQDYILSFMPLDVGDDQDSVLYFKPIINYIMRTDISSIDKYRIMINLVGNNKPFKNKKASVLDITQKDYSASIVEGYRVLFGSLIRLDCRQEISLEASRVLREHFNGLYNLDIIRLFIHFLIQSNIEYAHKIALVTDFISEDISQFDSFQECYQLVHYINSIGFERFTESKLTQIALRNCIPTRILSLEGYAILNRFIKDSRLRFEETYRLYLRFSESLIFKQSLIQQLYFKKILDKDEMLLFIDCVRVFVRLSFAVSDKIDAMQLNQDAVKRLGLHDYTDSTKNYHMDKIDKVKNWYKIDRDDLILAILIEKRVLLGDTFKESPEEKVLADHKIRRNDDKIKKVNMAVTIAKYVSAVILASIILIALFMSVLTSYNFVFIILTIAVFYLIMLYVNRKNYSLEIYAVISIGLVVTAIISSYIVENVYLGIAMSAFTLLIIPLCYIMGYMVFDPLNRLIISKDSRINRLLMSGDRTSPSLLIG